MRPLLLLTLFLADPSPPVAIERLGRLDHAPIREASGLVKSRKHPGIFWTHNDSGNPPALFAVRRDGRLVREFSVNVLNVDWEDIATDDKGHLYVGDIGNNDNRLPFRAIYQIDEPDPAQDGDSALKVTTASYYKFPPEGRFDAEGLVIDGDRALIVAKTFDGRSADVYEVPIRPPAPMFSPAVPRKVGTLEGFREPVTGASLSNDGRRLAVCSVNSVGVFQRGPDKSFSPRTIRPCPTGDQVEAVAWDGDDLILAGEGRGIYRVRSADWRGRKTDEK